MLLILEAKRKETSLNRVRKYYGYIIKSLSDGKSTRKYKQTNKPSKNNTEERYFGRFLSSCFMYTKDPDQELRLDKSQITVIATVMALVAEGFGDQKIPRVWVKGVLSECS